MKSLVFFVVGSMLIGCANLDADPPKTPDQIADEQEQLGAEQQKKGRNPDDYAAPAGATEDEKKAEWDDGYAGLELRRAARSAETCPESVTEKAPKGKAHVTLTFANDGHVKESSVAAPYEDTAVGKCVLRAAIKAVIVPAYQGAEQTVNWEIDLTGAKKSAPVGGFSSDEDAKKK